MILTLVEGIHTAAQSQLISANDAGKYGQQTAGQPPAKGVAKEVDLLASIVMSPEGDTAEKERP